MNKKYINLFLKKIKFISLLAFVLFTITFTFYFVLDGFIFIFFFLLSFSLYYFLDTKLQSQHWLIEIAKDFFVNILIFLIILILVGSYFLLLGKMN